MSKSIKDMLANVPKDKTLVPAQTQNSGPKTGPGQMMAFMAKESEAMQENEVLKQEVANLKASEVDIGALVEVEGRRRVLSNQEYEELKANITQNKLTTPITVRPLCGGQYEIVSGHNRVAIYKELGRTRIPAFIRDYTLVDAERGAFYANLLHKTLPDYEKYLGFKKIMALTGKTQTEIADEAGFAKSTVSYLMSFDDLPEDLRAKIAVRPALVGAKFASELAKLPAPHKALDALLDGGVSAKDAIKFGQAQEAGTKKQERPQPVIVKSGHKRLAELVNRSGTLSIKFSNPDLAQSLMPEIEALIRAKC
jgi:ParB family chromosome partitioning protein